MKILALFYLITLLLPIFCIYDPFDDSGTQVISLCTDSSYCPNSYKCCYVQPMRNGWGCCPYPDGNCCPNQRTCVPNDQSCENNVGVPLRRSGLVDEMKAWTAISMFKIELFFLSIRSSFARNKGCPTCFLTPFYKIISCFYIYYDFLAEFK